MNGKKAKILRREAEFDPNAERIHAHMLRKAKRRRHGSEGFGMLIHGTLEATGARKRYQALKKAYRNRHG
jgi:hypothetical protein